MIFLTSSKYSNTRPRPIAIFTGAASQHAEVVLWHCHVDGLVADGMLNGCLVIHTVAIASRGKSSRMPCGFTTGSRSAFGMSKRRWLHGACWSAMKRSGGGVRSSGTCMQGGLRKRRARAGDKWHLDEVFLNINGVRHYPAG